MKRKKMSAHGYKCIWEPGLIFGNACSAALFVCSLVSAIVFNLAEKKS